MNTILLMVLGYILGSIPNALWIGKVFKGIDVREHGSKNTGSTNAARVLGFKLGVFTLILDILKGAIPTFLAMKYGNFFQDTVINGILVGIVSIFGHSFSIFLKFKGGKAVATTVGVFLILVPKAILFAAIIFFGLFAIFKYVSLSSIFSALSLPIFIYLIYKNISLTFFGIIIAILIVVRHKSNIEKLLNGTESKFGIKKNKNK